MAQTMPPLRFQEEHDPDKKEVPEPAKSGVRAVPADFVRAYTKVSGDVRIRFQDAEIIEIEDDSADRVDEDLMERAFRVSNADQLLEVIDEMLIRDEKSKKKKGQSPK